MLDYSPSSIVSDDVRSGSLSDKLKGIRSLAGQIARGLKAGLSFRFRVDAFAQSSLFVIQWCGVLSIVLVAREFFGPFDFDVTEFVAAIAKTAHAFAPPLTYLYWFSTLWLF